MRFSANVSIMFKEVPFLDRFGRARDSGFSAVEFWWPSDEDLGEVEKVIKDAEPGGRRSSTSTPEIWRPETGGSRETPIESSNSGRTCLRP